MHRLNYAIAALAVIAFVSPSLAEDGPRAGPSAKTERTLPGGGEAKRETTSGRIGGARAEQVVIVHHRHHHHHHHYHHAM